MQESGSVAHRQRGRNGMVGYSLLVNRAAERHRQAALEAEW